MTIVLIIAQKNSTLLEAIATDHNPADDKRKTFGELNLKAKQLTEN